MLLTQVIQYNCLPAPYFELSIGRLGRMLRHPATTTLGNLAFKFAIGPGHAWRPGVEIHDIRETALSQSKRAQATQPKQRLSNDDHIMQLASYVGMYMGAISATTSNN